MKKYRLIFNNYDTNKQEIILLMGKNENEENVEICFIDLLTTKFDDENSYKETVAEIDENIEEIKNHLVDDNMIVKKGTAGITVKLYSED